MTVWNDGYRMTDTGLFAPSGERIASIDRMLDGAAIRPLSKAVRREYPDGIATSPDADEIEDACARLARAHRALRT